MNASPIIPSEMWGEVLCVQVSEDIIIPSVINSDEKEMFIE